LWSAHYKFQRREKSGFFLKKTALPSNQFGYEISGLARIFHSWNEQRSGEGVPRLELIEPNETAIHRFFWDRV
jgi:hypothetical protein